MLRVSCPLIAIATRGERPQGTEVRRPPRTSGLTRGPERCDTCRSRQVTHLAMVDEVGSRGRCPMRLAASVGLCLCVVLGSAPVALATCDPTTEPDKADVANARAAVAANCDCAGATSHGAYVGCAAQQANLTLVNKSCAGAVKRCAARSTCGKPVGAVTCCVTKATGTKCKIKRDAEHCTGRAGSTACVGSYTSCCDACGSAGCATTTTTTTTTSSTTSTTFGYTGCDQIFSSCGSCGAGICVPVCGPGCTLVCVDTRFGTSDCRPCSGGGPLLCVDPSHPCPLQCTTFPRTGHCVLPCN